MENSFVSTSGTMNERSPLLDRESSTPVVDRELTPLPADAFSVSVFSKAVVCILFLELCERLTFFGIIGNLVLFATDKDQLNLTETVASVISYVFAGTCYISPVFAGWLADSVAGKFSVIFIGAIVYLFGAVLLVLGTITKTDSSDTWAVSSFTTNTTFKRTVYLTGLVLVAIGAGTIKANVSPFGADQVSNKGQKAIQVFFMWFDWFINIGAMVAFTVVVYVQQNVSYFWGYLIPAGTVILTLVLFLLGKSSYYIRPPTGSVLSTTLKIVWEAIKRSRHLFLRGAFVPHWLDRAKVSFGGSYISWEVEGVKNVFRVIPIFGTFILYWTVYNQMNTSMIIQGKYMDIDVGSNFQIPIASLAIFDILGVLVLIPVMDKLFYPLLSRCGIHLSQLQRIGIGMIIAAGSMLCAGGLELIRIDQCCQTQQRGSNSTEVVSNLTIFAQFPQYLMIGMSEVFTSVTGLELAYVEAPKFMQGVVMGVFLLTSGLGSYVGAAVLEIINAITGRNHSKDKWFPDKEYINDGKLANYFFFLAGLMMVNFIFYVFMAFSFKAKKEAAKQLSLKIGNVNRVSSSKDGEHVQTNKMSMSNKQNVLI